MNVLTLIPNKKGFAPGQRSSIELWESILKPAGIRLHYVPFESDRLHGILYKPGHNIEKAAEMFRCYVDRLRLMKKLDQYGAVFVYREAALLGPAFLENMIARRGKPIIYQLDDPLYVPYRSPANGYLSYLKFFGKIAEIIKISKVVIANSSHIREYAKQYNENVWQIPSVVDTDNYSYRPEVECDSVCIGWSGSRTTVPNIKLIAGALQQLASRIDHRVHLIGGTDFDLPGVRYTAQNWHAETEVNDLRKMHVGMVPLPLTEWNKRKFYMKSAQYMALGIPPVCTPLGSNPEVIQHGETGFLANTTEQWVEYLEQLISDATLRKRMSAKAAQVAREKFSLQANAEKIIQAFRTALT
jgi:glycosyltransferase involved in cell wall biosynthesis